MFGGILGAVPQCGFSAAATSLYAGRVITLGTLIAIYLSTSDEMLPILISEKSIGTLTIIKILILKMVIGMIAGFLIDFLYVKAITEQAKIRKSIFMNCVSMTTATAEKQQYCGFCLYPHHKNHRLYPACYLYLNTVLHMWGEENLRGLF